MRIRMSVAVTSTLALALVAAGCGSKGGSSSPGGGSTLHLGASVSLTGATAKEGGLVRQGYEVCQEVINSKGGVKVGGKSYQLDISYQDDQSIPDTSAQLIDQFNDKGTKLILGPYGSAPTEAAAAVVERNGQVMVDSLGADDKIFSHGYQRTFAVLSPATEYAASIVRAAAELAKPKPQTAVFLSADDGFSKTATKGGLAEAEKQGMRVLATEYFPNGATDVSGQITKIKGLHPDLVVGSAHLAEGVAIVKQSHELGFRPAGGFGETVAPPIGDFAKTLGSLANGVLGSSQWTVQTAGSEPLFGTAKDYQATFEKKFGTTPQYHNAAATAACLAMVLAVEKAGSTDPGKVRDALSGLDTQSFFGPIKFDSTGKNVTKKMEVIQVQSGKAVQVWPAASAQAALVWPGVG